MCLGVITSVSPSTFAASQIIGGNVGVKRRFIVPAAADAAGIKCSFHLYAKRSGGGSICHRHILLPSTLRFKITTMFTERAMQILHL